MGTRAAGNRFPAHVMDPLSLTPHRQPGRGWGVRSLPPEEAGFGEMSLEADSKRLQILPS